MIVFSNADSVLQRFGQCLSQNYGNHVKYRGTLATSGDGSQMVLKRQRNSHTLRLKHTGGVTLVRGNVNADAKSLAMGCPIAV